jgi:MOSC domain-containing protein YiiM
VQQKLTRDQNFRGIYWKVVAPGAVAVGDPIAVLSR